MNGYPPVIYYSEQLFRNVSSLTDAMMTFIRMTTAQRTLMGNAGRRLVSARFDEKKIIGIYFDLLAQHIRQKFLK